MPTGKARTRVAFIDRPDFSRLDVQLQFLTEHRRAGYSLPTDEPSEITVAAIRNALEMYVGCHRKTPPITLTVRRKTLNALWEAVQAALSDPRDGATVREAAKWIAKLDINARNDLYHFLTAAARDGKIGKSDPIAFLQWPHPRQLFAQPLRQLVAPDRRCSRRSSARGVLLHWGSRRR